MLHSQAIAKLAVCILVCGLVGASSDNLATIAGREPPAVWAQAALDEPAPPTVRRLPLNARLVNQQGRKMSLRQMLNGRAAILVFTDFGCMADCNDFLRDLSVKLEAPPSLNRFLAYAAHQYSRIAISLDPSDTPHRALDVQQMLGETSHWHLMTTPNASTLVQLASQAELTGTLSRTTSETARSSWTKAMNRIVVLNRHAEVVQQFAAAHPPSRLALGQALAAAQDSTRTLPLSQWRLRLYDLPVALNSQENTWFINSALSFVIVAAAALLCRRRIIPLNPSRPRDAGKPVPQHIRTAGAEVSYQPPNNQINISIQN